MHRTVYLVLRHTPFQESSIVISGITPDLGRLNFIVKGARRTGKKSFPQIGLFRELEVEFRIPDDRNSLMTLSRMDLLTEFDHLALHTENYIAACEFARFLLTNVKPMLAAEQSYAALKTMLRAFCASDRPEPWLTLARLSFLNEAGLLPEPEGEAVGGVSPETFRMGEASAPPSRIPLISGLGGTIFSGFRLKNQTFIRDFIDLRTPGAGWKEKFSGCRFFPILPHWSFHAGSGQGGFRKTCGTSGKNNRHLRTPTFPRSP